MTAKTELRQHERAMDLARSYEEWFAAAQAHDATSGMSEWRLEEPSDLYDHAQIRYRLDRLRKLPMRSLSAGQQRRVALARMLLSGAELWLMDEPFTNLDRDGRKLVEDIVGEHLAGGGMCAMAAHQDVSIDAPPKRVTL